MTLARATVCPRSIETRRSLPFHPLLQVELMLKVASGEKLPSSMIGAPIPILGHAFESRVYAEDPFRGFLPSTGRLSKYAEPTSFSSHDPYLAEPYSSKTDRLVPSQCC